MNLLTGNCTKRTTKNEKNEFRTAIHQIFFATTICDAFYLSIYF
jgi:hypothetical protein